MVGEMLRLLTESAVDSVGDQVKGKEKRHISSFQAFAVSVATRVGTGNLAGVATAIVIGGPGAVFWMWLIALIGSATAFVESTLAQLYKQKHKDSFIGGPAYYIQKGLKCRWMAVLFAILITLQFGLSNNSIQANTICGAMQEAFGWSPIWVGVALATMALFIVFGGIQRIAKVSSVIVPLMAVGYIILALVIIIMNIHLIPHVFKVIILDAFGFSQIAGGSIGAAMMNGIKRGLFSNEAGEGSAPNAAATASTTHPVKQGLIQALGVFTDTLMVCSCTAFIILISGLYQVPELNGIALTQSALQSEIGSIGPMFIAVAIFLFAFSSIIGNYYYGEANIRFITQNNKVMTAYRIASAGLMVMFGALASFELVWNIVDLFMAFLTACNLIAIVLLGRYAFRLLDDYRQQKRQGIKEPVFHRSQLPEIEDELECWE
jgi:AGCS family alanine or glycine:cation symporter